MGPVHLLQPQSVGHSPHRLVYFEIAGPETGALRQRGILVLGVPARAPLGVIDGAPSDDQQAAQFRPLPFTLRPNGALAVYVLDQAVIAVPAVSNCRRS